MKKVIVLAALLAASGSALADGQALMSSPGGAFRATHVSGYIGELQTGFSYFDTFCIEDDEFFTPGTTYYARIADASEGGGSGGPSPDPISSAASLAYRNFREGIAINGTVVTEAFESNLQNVIWALEEENPYSSLSAFEQGMYDWAVANANGSQYGVRALQLWANPDFTGNVQDMLTIVPLPPAAWAGLGSLGMVAGVGYFRRRSQRA